MAICFLLSMRARRQVLLVWPLIVLMSILLLRNQYWKNHIIDAKSPSVNQQGPSKPGDAKTKAGKVLWSNFPLRFRIPASSLRPPPFPSKTPPSSSPLSRIPRIQTRFREESPKEKKTRLSRRALVLSNFTHAWKGYRARAWLSDEIKPLSGTQSNAYGGWAVTLVDSLDTLWIMGLREDFEEAVMAVATMDFAGAGGGNEINLFETTIRYLGGFLGAYDISGGKYPILLKKATELAEMLYVAFDTQNHLPVTRWPLNRVRTKWLNTGQTDEQTACEVCVSAELGSLTLEFTRLSQLTRDPKYFDAVQRVMDVFARQQDYTQIPGLWPLVVNGIKEDLTLGGSFSVGGKIDSLYEYLPKQYLLLGGADLQSRDMYIKALGPMKRHIFYRPNLPDTALSESTLLAGELDSSGQEALGKLVPRPIVQHLSCFVGGMVGLASRALGLGDAEMNVSRALTEGCMWMYENSPGGIMPEILSTTMCPRTGGCLWDESTWHKAVVAAYNLVQKSAAELIRAENIPPGVTSWKIKSYILRPEAIESIWYLYRLTGDKTLADRAWRMFENIVAATETKFAHASLTDCTRKSLEERRAHQNDRMESFWLAETLKYFYLMFETDDVLSLDEFVLNTEAHPFRWRTSQDVPKGA